MSAIEEAIQRAKQRGGPAPAPAISPQAERQLGAILDRDTKRERYCVERPGSGPLEVVFNPWQTVAEVRAMYPGCRVTVAP